MWSTSPDGRGIGVKRAREHREDDFGLGAQHVHIAREQRRGEVEQAEHRAPLLLRLLHRLEEQRARALREQVLEGPEGQDGGSREEDGRGHRVGGRREGRHLRCMKSLEWPCLKVVEPWGRLVTGAC